MLARTRSRTPTGLRFGDAPVSSDPAAVERLVAGGSGLPCDRASRGPFGPTGSRGPGLTERARPRERAP